MRFRLLCPVLLGHIVASPLSGCSALPDLEAIHALDFQPRPKKIAQPIPFSTSVSPHITMEQAVQQALAWHPSLNEAAGKVRESSQKIVEAKTGYLPGLSVRVRAGYSGKRNDAMKPKFQLNGKQMLYDFGKVSSSIQTEIAGRAVSRARFISAVDQLARDTALAVVESKRNKQLLDVAGQQVRGLASIVRLVAERTDSGASPETDQVQAVARLEAAKATQFQYQAAYGRELANLGSLIGREVVLSAGIPVWLMQACNITEPDWLTVPGMLIADAQHQRAEGLLKENQVASLPTISLEGVAGYDPADGRHYGTDQLEYSLGVNVSSPIYQGGASVARKRAASHALESAAFARDAARVSLQGQLKQARNQVSALRGMQARLVRRTQMMMEARDLSRVQYADLGIRTLLNLLDAEKELHETRMSAVNAEYDLQKLYVSCLYNSGKIRERFGIDADSLRLGLTEE